MGARLGMACVLRSGFIAGFLMGTILLIILVLLLLGVFPSWPHSREWGYGPSGGLGLILIIVLILVLLRVI